MKPRQTDELLFYTQTPHPKMKTLVISTTLRKNANLIKVKHLWNQIQNPTDITQVNPLEVPESSYSEIFTGKVQNKSLDLHHQFPKKFFIRTQTQAEIERLR